MRARALVSVFLAAWVLGGLPTGAPPSAGGTQTASAEEDLTPKEREKRIKAAKKALLAEERAFAKNINKAIDQGLEWLGERIPASGEMVFGSMTNDPQNLGRHALVLYTLAKCGVKAKDKRVKRLLAGIETWRAKMRQPGWNMPTYSVCVLMLAFDALHRPVIKPTLPGDKPKKPKKLGRLPKEVAADMQGWVTWLISKQETNLWRYPGAHGPGGKEDLSHGQYVLLALHAAAERGLNVPKSVWARTLPYLLNNQEESGPEVRLKIPNPAYEPGVEDRYGKFMEGSRAKARGWGYIPKKTEARSGSMTTAGVACLAIVKSALMREDLLAGKQRREIDTALVDGLAWLQRNFTVTRNPGVASWHYYYLYGLERVGALLGRKYIGEHDWYREGAEYLLSEQTESGAWPGGGRGRHGRPRGPHRQHMLRLAVPAESHHAAGDPRGPCHHRRLSLLVQPNLVNSDE